MGGQPGQIKEGIYAPLKSGGWSAKPVKFWMATRARAAEIVPGAIPGEDYGLTEVVHCKSKSEVGVSQARSLCSEMYLLRVLEAAPSAVVLVIYGSHARVAIQETIGIELTRERRYVRAMVAGRERHLVHLDHPASFLPTKTFSKALTEAELVEVREACNRTQRRP